MNDIRIDTEQDVESFSIKTFLLLCLGYWKWFLASAIVFVGMSLFYLAMKQPQFERSEEILVKDQDSGGGIADISNAFSSLGLFSSNTSVYNELIAFTSPAVMFEVVERLDLTYNLTQRDGLKKITLYGTSQPMIVDFPELANTQYVGLDIYLEPDGSFTAKKFYTFSNNKKVKFDGEAKGKVGAGRVSTPLGPLELKPNDAYIPNPKYEGETLHIEVFKQSLQGAVEKYVAKLKGDLTDQDADVINLSIRDTSVQRADDILNTVVQVYNERWLEDKNKLAVATSKFISERLVLIEKELQDLDSDIASQKSNMKIPDLEEAAKGYMAQDFKMNEELLGVTNMLAMSKYLKEYLQEPEHAYSILPMNTGTENQVLEQQIGSYNELLLQRNNLAENSGDSNPLVKDLNKQLAGMRNAIMRSIDSHIANLQNTLKNIDKAQADTKGKLGNSPQQAKTLLSVERQQLVAQELYLFLLQKREENELSQAFTADNTRIITPPYGKQKPVSPKRGLIIIVAFIIGIGVPAGALFFAEASNTKVRSKKDIDNLPVPYAGEIPHIGKEIKLKKLFQTKKQKRKEIDKPRIVVSEGKRDVPNEAFRVVRSNIDFMLGRGDHPVIALTSFNPGSGKSFIAFNLGASFALKGKKVLIIDGDLRHGSISAYVNSPRKGLTTYLNGNNADWENMVVSGDGVENLYVLPIGTRPPNPAELLDNGRLERLMEEAKSRYDVVLVDCPPVNIVVDTQILNQYVTRTLFVIRAGLFEKKGVSDLLALIQEKKLKNITLLLNGTKTEFSTYHTYGNYEALENI